MKDYPVKNCETCAIEFKPRSAVQRYCCYTCNARSVKTKATKKKNADKRYSSSKTDYFDKDRYKIKKNYMKQRDQKEFFISLAEACLKGLKKGIEEYPMKPMEEVMAHYLEMVRSFTDLSHLRKNEETE